MTREGFSPAPERRDDEVSLRDLYLVLLRGLPLVLLLALVSGGVSYYLNAQRRPVYAAESTVLVTPPPIQIEGDEELSFSPINEVSFQTYETLARSQLVLNDAAARVRSAGDPEGSASNDAGQVGGEVDPAVLASLGTLRQLIGPQRVGDVAPLAVIHRVRNGDPERAAQLADAWAQSTLAAVRESLFSSLRPVDEATTQEVRQLQRNVEAVEARVQEFAAEDNGPLLEAELEGLTRQLIDGRERQGELTREIAAAEARVQALQEQLGGTVPNTDGATGGATLEPTLLNVLAAREALADTRRNMQTQTRFIPSAQLDRAFEAALAESDTLSALLDCNEDDLVGLAQTLYAESLRPLEGALAEAQRAAQRRAQAQAQGALELALLGYASAQTAQNAVAQNPATQPTQPSAETPEASADALSLLSAAELRREQVALAGMRAERADLTGELSSYTEDAAAIQQRLATLEQRRNRLERELDNVLSSYDDVAGLQSSVSYLTELAPTNARILSQASVPRSPVGPRRGFNTVLAAVGGALVGLVLVFLRAAVRRPSVTSSRKATA